LKATSCAAAVLSLLLLACGGGSRNSPTSPQGQLVVSVVLDAFSKGGVLAASVAVDGRELGRSDWSTLKDGCTSTCVVEGAQDSAPSPGPHTVTVTVLRQTLAVVDYNVRGSVFLAVTEGTGSIPLTLQTVNLKAGDTVRYDIST
jgi:hypothetical protein